MISARPWPNGCFLSGLIDDILNPRITMTDVSVSDIVCQASAIMAIEPVESPTQYLNPNNTVFRTIDRIPSR